MRGSRRKLVAEDGPTWERCGYFKDWVKELVAKYETADRVDWRGRNRRAV